MGLFKNILTKLGIKKDSKEEEAPAKAATAPTVAPARPAAPKSVQPKAAGSVAETRAKIERKHAEEVAAATKAAAVEEASAMVDVMSKLESMAEGTKLDWKASIVDLLKVLDIDSSLEARKELAQELGCPPELMGGDSAKMNVWLHKTVLKKIAENGGNIPQELLD